MKKRIFSMLLVLLMAFSCLTVTAMADEAEGETGTETEVTAYTPAEGDVFFVTGTLGLNDENKAVDAYVVAAEGLTAGAQIKLFTGDLYNRNGLANAKYNTGRFWQVIDGKLTAITDACYSEGTAWADKYGYHDSVASATAVEGAEGTYTVSVIDHKAHRGADIEKNGAAKACTLGFGESCGSSHYAKTRLAHEVGPTLTFDSTSAIIDLRAAVLAGEKEAITTVDGLVSATKAEGGQAVVNTYSADAIATTSGDNGTYADNAGTVTAFVVTDTADSTEHFFIKEGEIFFVPDFPNASDDAKVFTKAYVVSSERAPVGKEVELYTLFYSNHATYKIDSMFVTMVDGSSTRVYGATSMKPTGLKNKVGFHDVISALDTEANTVSIASVAGHTGKSSSASARACDLDWYVSGATMCGSSTTSRGHETAAKLSISENLSIIDVRADVLAGKATAATSLSYIKKLTDAKMAVVNTYAADGTSSAGTLDVIVVQDFSTGYVAEYPVTASAEVGTLALTAEGASEAAAAFTAGTKVTVTLEGAEGAVIKTLTVDDQQVTADPETGAFTFTVSGFHTVEATVTYPAYYKTVVDDVVFLPGAQIGTRFVKGYVLNSETPTELKNIELNSGFSSSAGTSYAKSYFKDALYVCTADGNLKIQAGYGGTQMTKHTFGIHDQILSYNAEDNTMKLAHATNHIQDTDGKTNCEIYDWPSVRCGGVNNERGNEMSINVTVGEAPAVIDLRETETAITTFDELMANNATHQLVVTLWGAEANVVDAIIILEAIPHTSEVLEAVAPTCTETGLTAGEKCSTCGKILVAQEEVAALGHSYSGAVTTEPTCTDKGEKTYTCANCSDTYTEEVAALGHSYEAVVTDPTCTTDGYTTHTCTRCDDSYVDSTVTAPGHSYDAVVTDPTYNDQGYTTYTCPACGDSYVSNYTDALPAAAEVGGVKYGTLAEAVAAAQAGETVALLDDVTLTETIVVTGAVTVDLNGKTLVGPDDGKANWYAFIVNGGALTLKDSVGTGELYAKCYGVETKSGTFTMESGKITATKNETVGAAVVNYGGTVVINGGEMSGVAYGVYTGGYFADAVTTIKGGTIIGDVTVEDWADKSFTQTVKSTSNTYATEEGQVWLADEDGYVLHTHNYDESAVTDPTCTAEGYTTHTCSACGDSYVDSKVDALGHAYGDVVTDPTCTEEGYTTHTCTRCPDSYVDSKVDALGHAYSDVVTGPTCTEEGYTTHTCIRCPDSYVDSKVDALGHSYNGVVTTAPTCTDVGEKTFTCATCGDVYTEEVVALGHNTVTVPAQEPTVDSIGWKEYEYCTRCDYTTYVELPKLEEPADPTIEVDEYKANGTAPVQEGMVFAGWFADAEYKTPYTATTGKAYAKFVHKDVFRIKAQISAGTTAQSELADIRFLTSVDGLKYKKVGFKITFGGKTVTQETNTVYSSIVSSTNGVEVDYAPADAFHPNSQYFVTLVLKEIPNANFDDTFTVTPYWVTQDGTVVDGVTNELCISMGF